MSAPAGDVTVDAGLRALTFSGFGEPGKVLTVTAAEREPVGPGQIRIACAAVGLNFLDVLLCRGRYPVALAFPAVPGVEVAGRVTETGAGAEHLADARVLACPALPGGALRSEVVIDAELAVELPDDIPASTAAALPVTYQTGWFALARARLTRGETVLVHAGAGGVGTAVIQLAKRRGARVIATAGGPEKVALCRDVGADVAVDYRQPDPAAAVRAAVLEQGGGVDVVVDPVGGPMTELSLGVLRFEGRYVAVGSASGSADVDLTRVMATNVDVIGLSWGSAYPRRSPRRVRQVYAELFAGVRDGSIAPVIGGVVGLDDAPATLDGLAARRTTGKMIVRLDEEQP